MKRDALWLLRWSLVSTCTLAIALFFISWANKTHAQSQPQVHVPVHMTSDWSNRHMVYSKPSAAEALRFQAIPRYVQQVTRRNAPATQRQPAQ
ncbi:MAG: hypothetical protein WBE21_06985 [Candidatus Acidiferrales bacterium]